jgi:hypothetical protein
MASSDKGRSVVESSDFIYQLLSKILDEINCFKELFLKPINNFEELQRFALRGDKNLISNSTKFDLKCKG